MSVERLQSVLQFSAQGADQVIAEVNRVLRALRSTTGATPFQLLDPAALQRIQGVRPQSYDRIAELQAAQELAARKSLDARRKEAELKADTTSSAEKVRVAENASVAAAIRESKARRALVAELEKFIAAPELAARKEQERLGAELARRTNDSLKRQEQQTRERVAQNKAFDIEERRIRAEQLARMRATATAAFADLPTSYALPRAEIDALLRKPVRQPGDTDKVFRQREVLADAQIAAGVAHSRLAEAVRRAELGHGASTQALRDSVNRATVAYDRASRTVIDSQRRLQVALDNEALVHAQNARRSAREDFITGFRGQRQAPYAEQIGQAFKFSVFYGTAYRLLFGLTQTLQATFDEGVAFQQAMTSLVIAAGRPKEELDQIADTLGRSATRAGFAPSQGVEIGARSLGLYGVTESDAAIQNRVMQISARVVNQLAVGSKMQPVDLQNQIAAIGQAMNVGAAGQFRIADLDAYMTRKFGVAQGSTLESVAQSASVGRAAGFSEEELFAIAASMISRTGQTSSAVGGFMAQIFSRGGEGSLVDVARKQGIDPDQELRGIVSQLAQLYEGASAREQAEISATLGRGKIQNAAIGGLIQSFDEILSRSAAAQTEAGGEADRQFSLRMNNIGGQLARLQGVMRDFASELGESGLLDMVGLGIVVFREFLESVNALLRVWNTLPNAIQDTVIALGLLKIAARTAAGTSLAEGLGSTYSAARAASLTTSAGLGTNAAGRLVYTGTGRFAPLSAGTTALTGAAGGAALRGVSTGLVAAGRAALGMIGPIGWAIGGLLALGALKNTADAMGEAQRNATEVLLRPGVGVGSSPVALQSYAGELRSAATQSRETTGLLMQAITLGAANNRGEATANRLDAEAKRISALAARIAARTEVSTPVDSSVFKGFGAEEVATGLEALEAGGATAGEQLKALRDILFGTADAANAAANAFDRDEFAGTAAIGLPGAASRGLDRFTRREQRRITPEQQMSAALAGLPVPGTQGKSLQAEVAKVLTGSEAEARLKRGLDELGISSEADIDASTAERLAAFVGEGIAEQLPSLVGRSKATLDEAQALIEAALAKQLLAQAGSLRQILAGTEPLSREDAVAAAAHLVERSASVVDRKADIDTQGRVASLRVRIANLRRIQAKADTDEPIGFITEAIDDARREIASNQIAELERLRRIAQRNADSKAEIAAIGQGFLRREIAAAIRGGDADQLAAILEAAGRGAARIARQLLDDARKVVAAARRAADAMVGPYVTGYQPGIPELAPFLPQPGPTPGTRAARRRRRELERLEDVLGLVNPARGDANLFRSGSDSGNPLLDPDAEKAKEVLETAAERAAAAAAANAIRTGSSIGAARAEIQAAHAALEKAEKGSVEYYNALGQLYGAQNSLAEAVAAYQNNLRLLNIDMTNPLKMARAAAQAAADKLRRDIASGKGADVLAQDRIDLRNAQASAEATAFSQNLQAMQTADELGRIKHSKYINYLENEKKRLEAVKNRTFQQQDHLDQVDRALKAVMSQFEGQFNFGDIQVRGLVYQARRYAAERRAALASQDVMTAERRTARAGYMSSATVIHQRQEVNIRIDGADTAKVRRVVEEFLGSSTRTRTTQPRRR